jgi:hypothetical protein
MSKAEQIIADFESERLTLEQTKALREEDLEAKEIKLLTEKEYYDNL